MNVTILCVEAWGKATYVFEREEDAERFIAAHNLHGYELESWIPVQRPEDIDKLIEETRQP